MIIGVICPSEIAIRRFMPALEKCGELQFGGVGVLGREELFGSDGLSEHEIDVILKRENEKAQVFVDNYGGKIYDSYYHVVTSPEIEAVYLPLPPALHFRWAKIALENGKHVLVEKPATVSADDTKTLIQLAEKNNLALHENYMFAYHQQLEEIQNIVRSGRIGDVRLYRISFGFPRRAANDFRYNKKLGGGALIDAGGYTIRYATMLLGPSSTFRYAQSNYLEEFDVDMYGSAALTNDKGVTAQISFGMDNNYKCDLEIWGSKGCITSGRILTAPAGFVPAATVRNGNEDEIVELSADDTFLKSINRFVDCVGDPELRKENISMIEKQSELVDEFKRLAGWIE